ncbi:DJ-1 family glyoxalase III [Hutsoniella sourekii]|uniref:DJ-1 family glyoxalase III n=1 Tax=Hutsoniella sourekii TaxID=87650 RepID=UPI00048A1A7C|nr:DJ-1 family glyoxalase III [Hutsoniella sourekii]
MTKVAVMLADGFETIEALAPVDILRRAEIPVETVGLAPSVKSAQGIVVKADLVIDKDFDGSGYDAIVIPGGIPGAPNLKANDQVVTAVKKAYQEDRIVAANCAGPIVLAEAGIMSDVDFTCAPNFEDQVADGNHQAEATVVVDGKVLTGRGAAVSLEFGYQLLDMLGGDSQPIREAMQYPYLFK